MKKNEKNIRRIGILLVVFLTQFSIFSQNRTIQGVVIDNLDHEPVPYVSILFNDSIQRLKCSNRHNVGIITGAYTGNFIILLEIKRTEHYSTQR